MVLNGYITHNSVKKRFVKKKKNSKTDIMKNVFYYILPEKNKIQR